jgi:hypothetical protein
VNVKDIMRKPVITVTEQATVREILTLLSTAEISGVPVVDSKGSLIGIVTEHDVMKAMLPSARGTISADASQTALLRTLPTSSSGEDASTVSEPGSAEGGGGPTTTAEKIRCSEPVRDVGGSRGPTGSDRSTVSPAVRASSSRRSAAPSRGLCSGARASIRETSSSSARGAPGQRSRRRGGASKMIFAKIAMT